MQSLGLNEQQARAYLALLDVDTATANELSKTSRVPRAKLYEVLEGLNRKGLVAVIPESPQRFRANPVSHYFDVRLEELRAEESELKRLVGQLMVQLRPGTRQSRFDPERDFVQTSHGRPHFPVLLGQLVRDAKSSLTIVGDRLFAPRLRMHEDVLRAIGLAARTRSVRILLPQNAVTEVDGRPVHLDELEPFIRRARLSLGDACVVVRDQESYLVTRFVPADLHPSRGNDRIEVGHDAEIAALWHRLAEAAWDAAPASTRRAV